MLPQALWLFSDEIIDVVERKVGPRSKYISSEIGAEWDHPKVGAHLLPYIIFPENGSIVGFELNVRKEGILRFQVNLLCYYII